MVVKKVKLVAPNNLPIVGILLEDGSICEFEYTYDTPNQVRLFELINRVGAEVLVHDGDQVLVDSAGNKWPSSDIEFDSILKG